MQCNNAIKYEFRLSDPDGFLQDKHHRTRTLFARPYRQPKAEKVKSKKNHASGFRTLARIPSNCNFTIRNFEYRQMKQWALGAILSLLVCCPGCDSPNQREGGVRKVGLSAPEGRAVAAFASGCFWCSEHIFEAVAGVDSAVSGYAGGTVDNPTYELVNTETTGHAETVLVYYDPEILSFEELTKVFFSSHDPTTPDRQGPDVGSSYRSILFYQNGEEKKIADDAIMKFQQSFSDPIVTEVKQLTEFYRAEAYHQDYIHHNPNTPYVVRVSIPRYEKFRKTYQGKLKGDQR